MQTKRKRRTLIDRLMPWGTTRRHYYELGRSGFTIIRSEGLRSFWLRAKPFIGSWLPGGPNHRYKAWIKRNEPNALGLERQKRESLAFRYRPKISVVTPVWNTDDKWLRLAIESVIAQTYDNWELCLADGGSAKPHVRAVLEEYAAKETRVKVKFLPENKGISGNSNEALSLATGEFIALLDHDDELAPFALFECIALLNNQPETDFIYSDEDKISGKKRHSPFFKPDWSPDLLLSCNYTCHLGLYRRSIAVEIGGFRSAFDGSQDYDLVLRYMDRTKRIAHVPAVLYHWRVLVESAASHSTAKPYAYVAGRQALSDYLRRNGVSGEVVDGASPGYYRVKRNIIGRPLVSIIIPSKDNQVVLKKCVDSILEQTDYDNYEIIIVDNQSTEPSMLGYCAQIVTNPKISVLKYDRPFNFSAINNWAASQAKGQHLLLLNDDTEVISPGWLSAMLEHAQRNEVGVVGALLLYPNGNIQHCGIIVGVGPDRTSGHAFYRLPNHPGYMGRIRSIGNCSAVTAACMMVRKEVFLELGGLDEALPRNHNDIDLCLKARAKGYLIVYTPYARLYHLESYSRGYKDERGGRDTFVQELNLFRTRWASVLAEGDPYYNPNLNLDTPDFRTKNS
jgi:GT2 family glycosyltransferase